MSVSPAFSLRRHRRHRPAPRSPWSLAASCLLALVALGWSASLAAQPAAASAPNDDTEITEQARVLRQLSAAVVGVRALATPEARSIDTLGQLRLGSGVVIGPDGLVLTIGYLILEADKVDLLLPDGRELPARVVAYDLATGFGLVQPLVPSGLTPVSLGSSGEIDEGAPHVIATGGEAGAMSVAQVISRRPYSGYWEYHIDGAIFTVPPRADHSGAGLFNARGELVGIGSLIVTDAVGPGREVPGNMFVPIDLLKPVLAELRDHGASAQSKRAWLGVSCVEHQGLVRVVKVSAESPAQAAGLQPGDVILKLDGEPVGKLEGFYKKLWSAPQAEREVTLEVGRGADVQTLKARTVDRMKTLRKSVGI